MSRYLIRVMLFLILGAITTIAVALACAAWLLIDQDIPGRFTSVQVRDKLWETFYVQKRFGHTRTNFIRGSEHYDASTGQWISSSDSPDAMWQETSAGWPWRALRCEREGFAIAVPNRFGQMRSISAHTQHGIVLNGSGINWRVLSYEPVWPALIGNVLVHSAAWYALIIGLFTLRKVNRTRRGLCIKCAYDLRGTEHEKCPECGVQTKPIRSQLRDAPATSVRLDDM